MGWAGNVKGGHLLRREEPPGGIPGTENILPRTSQVGAQQGLAGRSPLNPPGSYFQNGSQGVGWAPSVFSNRVRFPAPNLFQLLRRAEHSGKPNTAAPDVTGPLRRPSLGPTHAARLPEPSLHANWGDAIFS